jgi:hypothetical protein
MRLGQLGHQLRLVLFFGVFEEFGHLQVIDVAQSDDVFAADADDI